MNPALHPDRRLFKPTNRRTGWQMVYGLRPDCFPNGYANQAELGCLDAPTALPGGAVYGVTDTRRAPWLRFVNNRAVLRAA